MFTRTCPPHRTPASRAASGCARQRARAAARFVLSLLTALAAGAVGTARAGDLSHAPSALAVTDPIQADLSALARRGLLFLPDLTARPMLRFDLARALSGSLARDSTLRDDPTFARVLRAFQPEIDADRGGTAGRGLLDVRDQDNWLHAEAFSSADAEASPDHGFAMSDSTRLGIRASWIVWPNFHLFEEIYVGHVPNGRTFGDPLSPGTNLNTSTERVYGALHTRYADIFFGRDRLAWGPGTSGSLLLSGSAPAFTHLRLSRDFFGRRLHAVTVSGILDQAEGRYVAFHRLDWRAHPRLRLGLSEGSRYNASGLQPLYVVGIIPYQVVTRLLLRDNESRATDGAVRDNVMLSADASWEALPRLTLYGEGLLDDLHVVENNPTRLAYQLGADRVGRLFGREVRARFEWTRVWNWVYSTFYHADFITDGKPLGYPLGPDSRAFELSSEWIPARDWTLSFRGRRRDQGEGALGVAWLPHDSTEAGRSAALFQGVVETEWRLAAGLRYSPSEHIALFAEAGPAWVRNAGHVRGSEHRGLPGRLGASFRY